MIAMTIFIRRLPRVRPPASRPRTGVSRTVPRRLAPWTARGRRGQARAMAEETRDVDVVVAGGGLVGLSLALALARAGLAVAAVDREKPSVAAADAFDGRASAIAWGSRQVLAGIGVWDRVDAVASPIREIRVSDGDSPLFLHY